MPDSPIIKGGATPNDSNPQVIGGTYPNGVDWIEAGKPFANQGIMANRLRVVMNRLGTDNFQEQNEEIPGDIYRSGPQLDNGGDINYCMFLAATCVFQLIKKFHPKIGIKITAGNNQFFQNFQNAKGELLDSNHRRGTAINFKIIGIEDNKSFNELKEKDQNKINAIENVLQSVTAGNKYFQYINEYKKGTRDGDPRNNFLISMSGPCCPPPTDGNIYIEFNENGLVKQQHCDWWEGFVRANLGSLEKSERSGNEGDYDAYIEGIDEKLTAIGLALNNIIQIVDLYDIAEAWADEYNPSDSDDFVEILRDCPGGSRLRVKLPSFFNKGVNLEFPSINVIKSFSGIKIKFTGISKVREKGRDYGDRNEKYYAKGAKPRYLKGGKFFGIGKTIRRQGKGTPLSGLGGGRTI
tara:strand:+ start:2039 stop:3265 length:1227 start_codon:yes stop_codon:yes gene_type:complete